VPLADGRHANHQTNKYTSTLNDITAQALLVSRRRMSLIIIQFRFWSGIEQAALVRVEQHLGY